MPRPRQPIDVHHQAEQVLEQERTECTAWKLQRLQAMRLGQEGENIVATPAANLKTENADLATGPMTIHDVFEKLKKAPEDPAVRRERMRAFWAAERVKDAEYLAAKRAKAADELRAKAADFFAMKSTGEEIIVPIFCDREFEEAMAA